MVLLDVVLGKTKDILEGGDEEDLCDGEDHGVDFLDCDGDCLLCICEAVCVCCVSGIDGGMSIGGVCEIEVCLVCILFCVF